MLTIPEDAAPPLATTPVHPESVGTYGPEAVSWIESNVTVRGRPVVLRWWQRFALYRQLEHREDGSLVWRIILESAPRRSGKSERLKCTALWRLEAGPDLFEPEQLVMHTGKDLAIVREVMGKAWTWAEGRDGWSTKRGMTEPTVAHGDSRWIARSKDATVGYDLCLGVVDESWDIPATVIEEDMEPAMLERESPQLLLTSTAHRRATSLMKNRIGAALAADDGETLLLLWGAPAGADVSDPEVWRAASPYWSPDRARMIAAKYTAASEGKPDKEFDDPDPMAGFSAQYLNQWQLTAERVVPGAALIAADDWASLAGDAAPDRAPDAMAVESWFAEGVSVVSAWKVGGKVTVTSVDLPSIAAAAEHVAGLGAKTVLVGATLAENAVWRELGVRVQPASGRTGASVAALERMLSDDLVRWTDPADELTAQVLAVRTKPGSDGPRVVSTGRGDAIKAAVWAVHAVSTSRPEMVIPSRFKRTAQ